MSGQDHDQGSAHQDPGSRSGAGAASVHQYLPEKNQADAAVASEWEMAHHEARAALDVLFDQVMAFRKGEAGEADVTAAERDFHGRQERCLLLLEELKATRR